MRYEKKFCSVLGKQMAYVDEGEGNAIVFLHGNPTSSFLWRGVMPHLESHGRCVAPDLIGMGDSEKLTDSGPESYRFVEHRQYLDALLDQLDLGDSVTLVIHDWGSALGFDWANRNRGRVKGIAYMEAIVAPIPSWDDWPPPAVPVFQAFRSEAGEQMVIEQNVFVEQVLPDAILRDLDDAEMAEYRRPYLEPGESRRPTLTWPRQIPIAGEPEDVVAITADYAAWLATSDVPKLFVNAQPGAILRGAVRELCRKWPNQTEIEVAGTHFVQEDSPDEIGQGIAAWLEGL
ncbi:MAG: haloalkane dehalogenase [Myxococcota bacterium]|nr:haloalkane dehalogenase [Myxococcota bacterium]